MPSLPHTDISSTSHAPTTLLETSSTVNDFAASFLASLSERFRLSSLAFHLRDTVLHSSARNRLASFSRDRAGLFRHSVSSCHAQNARTRAFKEHSIRLAISSTLKLHFQQVTPDQCQSENEELPIIRSLHKYKCARRSCKPLD